LQEIALARRDDEFRALLLENALDAADGVALAVEEMADAAQELDVVRPVVAAAAAALQGLDLRETRLPEAQDMLRKIKIVGDFADRAEGFGTFRQDTPPDPLAPASPTSSSIRPRPVSTRHNARGAAAPVQRPASRTIRRQAWRRLRRARR